MTKFTIYAIIDSTNGEVMEIAKNEAEADTMRNTWIDALPEAAFSIVPMIATTKGAPIVTRV